MTQPIPGHSPAPLLNPNAFARFGRVDLIARQLMDGYITGMHKSPHVGFALDFAQHRAYVPGDDIKRIDWRAYAKADRYYIKQYEVTTNLRAYVVLDASASMRYKGAADALTKFRYAQSVAACLTYLILHQQDSAGLIVVDEKVRDFIEARSAPIHLKTIADALEKQTAHGPSNLAACMHQAAERVPRRSMILVLSDFLDDAAHVIEALHHFRHQRQEVILMNVMSHDELTFPFRKFSEFLSLEVPGQQLKLDPAVMRARYLENLHAHQDALKVGAGKLGMEYVLLDTSEAFDTAVTSFLARRAGSR